MYTDVLFSVIIPAYNAEPFIEACISSVCEQSFDSRKFEVIVVDDGSTDDTPSKVRRLQDKYPSLKLVCQENGRQGKARNTGVKYSVGQYIMFLDADDMWMYSDVLSRLKQIVTKYAPDYVFTKGYRAVGIDEQMNLETCDLELAKEVMDADTCIAAQDFSFSACNYVYKREIFIEKEVRFEEGCFFEDLDFCVRALYAKGPDASVIKTWFPYYGYRENPNSTTRKPNALVWLGNLAAIERILEFVKEQKPSDTKAMRTSLRRCQSDLSRKPIVMFKEQFSSDDTNKLYTRWLEVLDKAKQVEYFSERMSSIPLSILLFALQIIRLLRRIRRFFISMTRQNRCATN